MQQAGRGLQGRGGGRAGAASGGGMQVRAPQLRYGAPPSHTPSRNCPAVYVLLCSALPPLPTPSLTCPAVAALPCSRG